jgi:hypothetical protein
MSRYVYKGKEGYEIVVGWDNPLQTFHAEIRGGRERSECTQTWLGTYPEEIQTLEALAARVEPYGEIPPQIMAKVRDDYEQRTSPTPLQLFTRLFEMLT